jgi:Do/DeqQ family serine protease
MQNFLKHRLLKSDWSKLIIAALLGAVLALGGYSLTRPGRPDTSGNNLSISQQQARGTNAVLTKNTLPDSQTQTNAPDFRQASRQALPAVVHIKSKASGREEDGDLEREREWNPFRDFFPDMPQRPRSASGSGVILTQNGYVVTNDHVIKDADEIEVTLHNNKSYGAKVVGRDPSTDLALLKIDPDQKLQYLSFGSSEKLEIGQWVLAVGNPFNLESTVTAGIVSAKARSLGLGRGDYQIESFIQTDAAVNPGNSGGALINTNGQLVGINTAIASRTGSYVGYSFAIPASIVEQVVNDLKKYGEVRRAYLGVMIQPLNSELANEKNIDVTQGVYVRNVQPGSAAEAAGLQSGDVILGIDGQRIRNASELQEEISLREPGEEVDLRILREGEETTITAKLKSRDETAEMASAEGGGGSMSSLGAELAPVDKQLQAKLNIDGGVQVKALGEGKLRSEARLREGFIITHINKQPVRTPEEVKAALRKADKGVLLRGVYPNGDEAYYAFGY